MNCILIDDEPGAREILQTYIEDTPGLHLQDSFSSALEALEFLKSHSTDLMFLDVNMPRLSGISFLKSLSNPPSVILTTAYSEYALEGFELNVTDYLLKPFSFERFLKAVDKAQSATSKENHSDPILSVKSDGKLYRIPTKDICYVESQGDYITLYLKDQKLTYYETMKGFMEQVPENMFIRIHRSYIVSLPHIKYLEGNQVFIKGEYIPVGATYREALHKRL